MSDRPAERVDAEEVNPGTPGWMPLATVDQVRVEMARVYREVRMRKLDPGSGAKLVWMLATLAKVTEVATVEKRLLMLEDVISDRGSHHGRTQ